MLVPVKAFARAKRRLAPALPSIERATLARVMADTVLRAAGPMRTAVVCDDEEVAAWAHSHGVEVVWAPGLGLNGAVQAGVDTLAETGATHVTVAHADLPLADDLTWVPRFARGITLVPDRRQDGTNVIGLPVGTGFRFSYGTGSFARHVAEARRNGLPLRVVPRPQLGWDVDVPDDLSYAPVRED